MSVRERSTQALVRVCKMAGATVVGAGFLIEKVNDAGRAFLSGYQVGRPPPTQVLSPQVRPCHLLPPAPDLLSAALLGSA